MPLRLLYRSVSALASSSLRMPESRTPELFAVDRCKEFLIYYAPLNRWDGRAVRPRTANPLTAVQLRFPPPFENPAKRGGVFFYTFEINHQFHTPSSVSHLLP